MLKLNYAYCFSDHAKTQLKKRRISLELAVKIVKDPDKILLSFKNRKLRKKIIGDKILEIVTQTEGNKITVITGYFIKKEYEN